MREMGFHNFDDSWSPRYRRSVPSTPIGMNLRRHDDGDGDVIRRRGSVYHSSREVRSIQKKLIKHGRKEEEEEEEEGEGDPASSLLASSSQSNADFLSFEILDRSSSLRFLHDETSPSPSSVQRKIPNSDFPDLSFRILAEEKCVPGSSNQKGRDGFRETLKSRFGGLRSTRMQEGPKLKSKYQWNLSVSQPEPGTSTSVFDKPPLNDSPMTENFGGALAPLSPIHLSGILKLERRKNGGALSFQFFPNNSEDVLSAKVWRTNSTFNWVYTFHKSNRKSTTDGSGWRMKNKCRQSLLLIGQMQASCYLCSEINCKSLDTSTFMEFVLHDIAQARRSSGSHEYSAEMKCCNDDDLETSDDLKPWPPTELLPHLEIAAVSFQVPCVKEEENSRINSKPLCPPSIKVITPSGSHGLPSSDEGCPSPLLDRWRSDGVCDCGGWDMGCPIDVFDNNKKSHHHHHQSLNLFSQGAKYAIPALTLRAHEEGQYSVNFHAKFSALQAFSICVATLDALDPLPSLHDQQDIGTGVHTPLSRTKSLQLLLEEEVRHLLSVAVSEKENTKVEPLTPRRHIKNSSFSLTEKI